MKRKALLSCLSLSLVLTVLACAYYPDPDAIRTDVPRSSQDDYPVLPDSTANATTLPLSFAYLSSQSDLIIKGTVVEQLNGVEKTMTFEPETDAEGNVIREIPGAAFSFDQYRIQVDDVIRGDAGKEIVLQRNLMFTSASPELSDGSRMIFFLAENEGVYYPLAEQEAYYYVAEDNRVYPAQFMDCTRAYSGMGLSEFKKEIRSCQPYISPTEAE